MNPICDLLSLATAGGSFLAGSLALGALGACGLCLDLWRWALGRGLLQHGPELVSNMN